MKLNNINDVAEFFGTTVEGLSRELYNQTECGAWITHDEKGITIGSIVEGSEAEFQQEFQFPIESDSIVDWVSELEKLCDEAWHEANDEPDELISRTINGLKGLIREKTAANMFGAFNDELSVLESAMEYLKDYRDLIHENTGV